MAPPSIPTLRQSRWIRTFTILASLTAAASALVYYLESRLDSFYIFNPTQLHDLSIRAISAHGNDTRSVVGYIVDELSEMLPGGYINLDEEWILNNAGGAMGGMYIIHASKYLIRNTRIKQVIKVELTWRLQV